MNLCVSIFWSRGHKGDRDDGTLAPALLAGRGETTTRALSTHGPFRSCLQRELARDRSLPV